MFTEEVGRQPAAGRRRRRLPGPGRRARPRRPVAGLDRGRPGDLQGRDRRGLARRLPDPGGLGRARPPRPRHRHGGHRRRRRVRPGGDRAGRQPLRQRLQRRRPAPPTRGSASARSAGTPASCSEPRSGAVPRPARFRRCDLERWRSVRMRRGAVPAVVAPCWPPRSWPPARGTPRTTSARRPRPSSTTGRTASSPAAAGETTDRGRRHEAARADRDRPARRDAVAEGRQGQRQRQLGHRRLDRDLAPGRGARTGRYRRHAAACGERQRLEGRRRADRRPPASSAPASTWCSPARLPDRAAITDATGAPLFTPTEVVNVGVDPGKVTDLPGARRRPSPRRPASRPTRSPPTSRRASRASSSRSSRCAGPTSRRSAPRSSTCRARVFPTATRLLAPELPVRPRAARPGRRRPPRRSSTRPRTPRAGRGTPPPTSSGSPACSAPFQHQLTGTAGFTVTVVSTDKNTGDQGRQIAVRRAEAGHAGADPARPRAAERRRRGHGHPAAADRHGGRAAGHRRDPRGLLQRRRRPLARAVRPVPARLEHEDDDGDGAARRPGRSPRPARCPARRRPRSRGASSRTRTSSTWAPCR